MLIDDDPGVDIYHNDDNDHDSIHIVHHHYIFLVFCLFPQYMSMLIMNKFESCDIAHVRKKVKIWKHLTLFSHLTWAEISVIVSILRLCN